MLRNKGSHLELANDLTTDAFLACLKRFFAHRSVAHSMHSDNATNFVGTNNELKKNLSKELDCMIKDNQVQQYLSSKEITILGVLYRLELHILVVSGKPRLNHLKPILFESRETHF